ncbi:hypothetical protein [Paramylibacter ulvae]|nr:hypothetical protein [Amylibacter ulvae]
MSFASSARSGLSYHEAKKKLSCSSNAAETRKSMFEELALLFVPHGSNQILLTPLGDQLFDLLTGKDLEELDGATAQRATALLIWAMCKVQINRPQSRGSPSPSKADWESCDVKPYAAAWAAANDLGGVIHLHEFIGAIRTLHQVSDYDHIVNAVRDARSKNVLMAKDSRWAKGGDAFNPAIYWRSHLSLANQLMDYGTVEQTLTTIPAAWEIVCAALQFQSGCDGSISDAIRSADWEDAEDYFFNVAGTVCPPFLASGKPSLTSFEGVSLADLSSYTAIELAPGPYRIAGGPELCELPFRQACFHPASPARLLRIDRKQKMPDGGVQIDLGLGRPIANFDLLFSVIGGGSERN